VRERAVPRRRPRRARREVPLARHRGVPMEDVARRTRHTTIGLRHDCDAGHSLATAVKMAEWEAERGYRSTYYILHTRPTGTTRTSGRCSTRSRRAGTRSASTPTPRRGAEDGPRPRRDPRRGARDPARLRLHRPRCRGAREPALQPRPRAEGEITFANDEQFVECARPQEGPPDRTITRGSRSLALRPRPLADFGLDYEALVSALPHPFRCSDSGGKWLRPGFEETAVKFARNLAASPEMLAIAEPHWFRPLALLVHPDWWAQAFTREAVAA
jgi:hypothetical protein